MVERLFLDRIDAKSSASAVRVQDQLTIPVLPNKAESAVTWVQVTGAWTKFTEDTVPVSGPPPLTYDTAVGVARSFLGHRPTCRVKSGDVGKANTNAKGAEVGYPGTFA